MLVTCRTTSLLFEALDRMGVDVEEVLAPLGLERGPLADPSGFVAWRTVARICDRIGVVLGGDAERIQAVGRAMTYVPSYAALAWIARSTVSVRTFYRLAERWIAPANFPHLKLALHAESRDCLTFRGTIPEAHAPSAAFFHVTIGTMAELPVLMGLPPSKVVSFRVEPRSFEVVLETPVSQSLVAKAARVVVASLRSRRSLEVLEQQRHALAKGMESLQGARDELRLLLERLPDMVVIHVGAKIYYVNRAFVQALGYASSAELVGRSLTELIDPRSLELFEQRMRTRGDDPELPALTEAWLKARDGSPVLVEIAPTQEVMFDGEAARLVVGRNIGERARLQQQLATADRLASVGLLAAGVAHEINNPLAYILNNIEIARKQLAASPVPVEGAREALGVALEGVDRIRFIVRELLLLARGDEGTVGPTDVREVIESTLSLARVEIARTATVILDFQPCPLARASVPRVAQVVLNLVMNALEAMKNGDPKKNQLLIRVGATADERVRLEVVDNGVGVAVEDAKRVFDPFYTTKPMGEGTGLGLAITQRLVLELGGEITMSSKAGKGTTFVVVLPSENELPSERPARLGASLPN